MDRVAKTGTARSATSQSPELQKSCSVSGLKWGFGLIYPRWNHINHMNPNVKLRIKMVLNMKPHENLNQGLLSWVLDLQGIFDPSKIYDLLTFCCYPVMNDGSDCHGSPFVSICGYGSIPINTIFRGMNIHLPAILMWTTGVQGFDTLPCIQIPSHGHMKLLCSGMIPHTKCPWSQPQAFADHQRQISGSEWRWHPSADTLRLK